MVRLFHHRPQVSETEREDMEESEKVQHWVERLCQTRLEQISCVENESSEVKREETASSIRIFSRFLNVLWNVFQFLIKANHKMQPFFVRKCLEDIWLSSQSDSCASICRT